MLGDTTAPPNRTRHGNIGTNYSAYQGEPDEHPFPVPVPAPMRERNSTASNHTIVLTHHLKHSFTLLRDNRSPRHSAPLP